MCDVFSITENELHDHLLRDKKCESINQGGQCGSGILSYKALGKQQSKVNITAQRLNSKDEVKNNFC